MLKKIFFSAFVLFFLGITISPVLAQGELYSHNPIRRPNLQPGSAADEYDLVARSSGRTVIILHVYSMSNYGTAHLSVHNRDNVEIAHAVARNTFQFGFYDAQVEPELERGEAYKIRVWLENDAPRAVDYLLWAVERRARNECLSRLHTETGNLVYNDFGQNRIWVHPDGDDLDNGFALVNTQEVWAESGDNYGYVFMNDQDSTDVADADTNISIMPRGRIRIISAQRYIQLANGWARIDKHNSACDVALIAGSISATYNSGLLTMHNPARGITAIYLIYGSMTVYDDGQPYSVSSNQVYYKNENSGQRGSIRSLQSFGLSNFNDLMALVRQERDIDGFTFPTPTSINPPDPDIMLSQILSWDANLPVALSPMIIEAVPFYITPIIITIPSSTLNPNATDVQSFVRQGVGSTEARLSVSAGSINVSEQNIGSGCVGYVTSDPTVRINLSGANDIGWLDIGFEAGIDADPTMIVRTPDGRWYCDDDDGTGRNPRLTVQDRVALMNGSYDIWIGSYGEGSAFSGVINFSALAPID